MDPRYTGEIFKHLDKQNELLMESHKSMFHELQKLQVEEEMLMRKLYEIMSAHGLAKKNEDSYNVSQDVRVEHSNAIVNVAEDGQQ
ncbi:General vesicular transport factor p115 like [Quillaja saponaria]|uniref:General vesicular transport factor p115 like n=1 Tax=Quillaja saponaria TaxID=32244 RepID=A0AAD7PEM2_QUISA|nr:General vesicular transport factor p115 like [Quillaja saponaria]